MIRAGFIDQAEIALAPPAGGDERQAAVRFVTRRADSDAESRELLDMLGLTERRAS